MIEEKTDTEAVRLAVLAIEMNTTVAALERELGPDRVFRRGGFRCCTAFTADEVLREHERRRAEREAVRERNRQALEARRASRPPRAKGFSQFHLADRVIMELGSVPPVVAMTSESDKTFDGGAMTARPGLVDWIAGRGAGGGSFAPSRSQEREMARQRANERKKLKEAKS